MAVLIASGANVNATDRDGKTPIDYLTGEGTAGEASCGSWGRRRCEGLQRQDAIASGGWQWSEGSRQAAYRQPRLHGAAIMVDTCREAAVARADFNISLEQVLGYTLSHELGHCVGMAPTRPCEQLTILTGKPEYCTDHVPTLDAIEITAKNPAVDWRVTVSEDHCLVIEELRSGEAVTVIDWNLAEKYTTDTMAVLVADLRSNGFGVTVVDTEALTRRPFVLEPREREFGSPSITADLYCLRDMTIMENRLGVENIKNATFAYDKDKGEMLKAYEVELGSVDIANNYGFAP